MNERQRSTPDPPSETAPPTRTNQTPGPCLVARLLPGFPFSHGHLVLLLLLSNRQTDKDAHVVSTLTQDDLSDVLRTDRRTVRRWMADLTRGGYLSSTRAGTTVRSDGVRIGQPSSITLHCLMPGFVANVDRTPMSHQHTGVDRTPMSHQHQRRGDTGAHVDRTPVSPKIPLNRKPPRPGRRAAEERPDVDGTPVSSQRSGETGRTVAGARRAREDQRAPQSTSTGLRPAPPTPTTPRPTTTEHPPRAWQRACRIARNVLEIERAEDVTDALKTALARTGIDYGELGGLDRRPLFARVLDHVQAGVAAHQPRPLSTRH
jgi:hypothetical protein